MDVLEKQITDGWIPVSERKPDTDDEVLCWYKYYHWSQEKVLPEYGLGRYLKNMSTWCGEVTNGRDVEIIAWMPLPKPYVPDINVGKMEESEESKLLTYEDIFKEFCKKFSSLEIDDYRPAFKMYIPQLSVTIPNAIIVWFKDGSKIIYISEREVK